MVAVLLTLLQSPIVLLAIGIVGYLIKYTRGVCLRDILAKINVYVLLPILLFNSFARRGFLKIDAWISFSALLFTLVSLPLLLFLTRRFEWKRRASILITSMFPNAINIPFPLLAAVRGDYSYAAVYALAINLIQIILVIILAGYVSRKTSVRSQVTALLKLLMPVYGALAGASFYYTGIILPSMTWSVLSLIGDIAIDSIVFVAGLSLPSIKGIKIDTDGLGTVLFWRHVFSPLLTYLYLLIVSMYFSSVSNNVFAEVVTEAIMPPALINASFSITYGFDKDFTGKAILVSTPIGIILGIATAMVF
jgi:predicted permease